MSRSWPFVLAAVLIVAAAAQTMRATDEADRAARARARAEREHSYFTAFRDSLERGNEVPLLPVFEAGRDSAWYVDMARSARIEARYWHSEGVNARTTANVRLSREDLHSLREAGLREPAADLSADLEAHNELIPFRSNHGAYRFVGKSSILLPGGWVCGYFEDGMIPGYVLLRYRVGHGGRINWQRLDAWLDR